MKKGNYISTTIHVLIAIAICVAVGKSDKAAEAISLLPYVKGLTAFLKDASELFDKLLNPMYQSYHGVVVENYSDVMKTLMSSTISWVCCSFPPIQALLYFNCPTDDTSDPYDIYDHSRGFKTSIRYFYIGLICTVVSGYLFDFLFTKGNLPGISAIDMANAANGQFSVTLIFFAVLYLLLMAMIALMRHLLDRHHGTSFFLFAIHGRSFMKVGFIGFVIFSFLKDVITTAINSMIIVLVFSMFSNPSTATAVGTIILLLLGIGICLFCT